MKASREKRAECENVEFAEVEFATPVVPRLVIRFSDGLSILVENERAVPLAAAFLPDPFPNVLVSRGHSLRKALMNFHRSRIGAFWCTGGRIPRCFR